MSRSGSGKVLFAFLYAFLASALPAVAADRSEKQSAPSLACAGATRLSIALQVCAGASGTPGGFSIEWTTAAAFRAGPDAVLGTGDDNSWPVGDGAAICTASFRGQAQFSRREIPPNQCVTVEIGQLLDDSGATTSCSGSLECSSAYVFRSTARATTAHAGAPLSPEIRCGTLFCQEAVSGCTVTAAYWRDHGPVPTRANGFEWGVPSLTLGSVVYTGLDLQAILETPADGNGLIALAHQLIAAKLNLANGTDPAAIADTVAAADQLIGSLVVPPGGSGYLSLEKTWGLTQLLTGYNEGAVGPGHCD
ncbi:MAG TPA: hypothetical protein VLG15_14605 [Thermoanaerobaculia bacterium]|nr:hypothetical protein [Thermoanaerobaculia bacterium]